MCAPLLAELHPGGCPGMGAAAPLLEINMLLFAYLGTSAVILILAAVAVFEPPERVEQLALKLALGWAAILWVTLGIHMSRV